MNKIITLLTVAFLSLSVTGFSQQKTGSISGTVVDASAKTIESASITLRKARDSSVAKMGASDKKGKFIFENIAQGKYLVSVTAVGYQTAFSKPIEISPANTAV